MPKRKVSFVRDKFYRFINKDIKELNGIVISLFSILFLVGVGFISYILTNNSYALFGDSITGSSSIGVEASLGNLDKSGANEPILDTNMIAVYYDEISGAWKKADSTNMEKDYQWYDYNNKMWANSVTVTSASRSTYQNASPGTEIAMDDILTMQVWIPRYKYKVWNYNAGGTTKSDPQEIEIVFESETERTGNIGCHDTISGTAGSASESCRCTLNADTDNPILGIGSDCEGEYYTHPAFTFGEEEIEGFWIGKFELTGTIDNITTKPDLVSIRSQNVSTFATNIMAMNDSGNQYGFNTSVDTHMIKNMEWGAVAYLSHSKYGTCTNGACTEIGINNYSSFLTGCGAKAGSYSSSTCNSYETELGKLASTTGNIYGVYDMSGGADEYVMGNMVSTDGVNMMSGSSGFSTYPDSKYYDSYSYVRGSSGGDFVESQIVVSKLGDTIKETYSRAFIFLYCWYDGVCNLVNAYQSLSFDPWFTRGGRYNSIHGLFNSSALSGSSSTSTTSRIIIVF